MNDVVGSKANMLPPIMDEVLVCIVPARPLKIVKRFSTGCSCFELVPDHVLVMANSHPATAVRV